MYFKVLSTGNDYGIDFGEQLSNGSIASKIAQSKEQYETFHKAAKLMSAQTNEAYESIIKLWLLDLFDENPEQYEIYAVEFGDPEKGYLPVSSVRFEQDSVEWGLNDHIFNGYHAQAYPENASNRELTYTTSNKNVVEIMPNGYLEVRGLGKCTITATSVENDRAYDTLDVTVIEQDGKDSKRVEEIFPTTAPEFAVPKFNYSVNSNGTITLNRYIDTAEVVVIPTTINGKPVRYIGVDCFKRNYFITSVVIPDGVTRISETCLDGSGGSFAYSSLTSITIPSSVKYIDHAAFYRCESLVSVAIPEGVGYIGEHAFCGCVSLSSVIIPNSVYSIQRYAFESVHEAEPFYHTNIKDVYYYGNEEQWKKIVSDNNDALKKANIHFIDNSPSGVPVEVKITAPANVNTSNQTVKVSSGSVNKTLTITDGMLDVSSLVNGTYMFTFTANNCAPRDYTVTISNGTATGLSNIELKLYGDINGDGKINGTDVLKAKLLAKGGSTSDTYDRVVANVNKDSTVNGTDVLQLKLHAKGSKNLWQ